MGQITTTTTTLTRSLKTFVPKATSFPRLQRNMTTKIAAPTGTTVFSNASTWSSAATNYDPGPIGACNAQVTTPLLSLMHSHLPFDASSTVLELGAGTGIFTDALIRHTPGVRVLATDIASKMLSELQKRELPGVTVCMESVDATVENNVFIPGGEFTHSVSAMMAQFTMRPDVVVREMARATRPGGLIGLATIVDTVFQKPWEVACKRLDPSFVPKKALAEGTWGNREGSTVFEDVESDLRATGCVDVRSVLVESKMRFEGWEHYVDHWYRAKNPGMLRMQSAWKGDIDAVRETLGKVVKEEFSNGREFVVPYICTVARRPNEMQVHAKAKDI